jgi:hypothetical protein
MVVRENRFGDGQGTLLAVMPDSITYFKDKFAAKWAQGFEEPESFYQKKRWQRGE